MQSFIVKTEFTRLPTCVELLCWVYVNRSYFSKVKYMIGIGFKTRAHTPLPKLSPSHPEGLLPELDLSYWSRDFIQGSMRCHGQCVPSSAKQL